MFRSQAKKDGAEDDIAKYDGVWAVEPLGKDALTGDSGLVMKSKAKHRWEEVLQNWRLYWSNPISSAVAAKLKRPFTFREEKQLVLQYEVAFQKRFNFQFFHFYFQVAFQNGLDCGGGYVKLLSSAKVMMTMFLFLFLFLTMSLFLMVDVNFFTRTSTCGSWPTRRRTRLCSGRTSAAASQSSTWSSGIKR